MCLQHPSMITSMQLVCLPPCSNKQLVSNAKFILQGTFSKYKGSFCKVRFLSPEKGNNLGFFAQTNKFCVPVKITD